MPLEELAPKYAPKSYAELTEDFLDQATIDGHMYGFPPTFFQYNCMGYIVRGDLMKKYGMTEIKNMEDYGKYLDNVVKNDPQLDPTGFMATSDGLFTTYHDELGWYNVSQNPQLPFSVEFHSDDPKIFNVCDTPEMKDFYVKMKEWGDKGYWPKSVLSNKDEEMLMNGKAASRIHGLDSWKGVVQRHPEYEAQWYPMRDYCFTTEAMQDGMAVPASSQNPERALMFLEKLRQEEEYYDFLTYGVKGETYNITEDGKLEALDIENFAPEQYCSWGFKSLKFFKEPVGTPPELATYNEALSKVCEENPYQAFKPNTDPIKNEIASIANVMQQYGAPLGLGYVDDTAAGYNTLLEQLKAAGSDKVIAELQTQLDAYLAARK